MKNLALLFTMVLFPLTHSIACEEKDGALYFLPEHNVRIPAGLKSAGGISEADFNAVLAKAKAMYESKVNRMGFKLKINADWKNDYANASADYTGELKFYGGLARHSSTTKDSFALVVCHEMGHLIGGFPKITFSTLTAESQADYFGTLKCMRQMFLDEDNKSIIRKANAPKALVQKCEASHGRGEDAAICVRSGLAAVQVSKLIAFIIKEKKGPELAKNDPLVVGRTNTSYPSLQCRLDTFVAGAVCEKAFTEDVSQTEEVQGTCHQSTGHEQGTRPACWFKARI